MIDEYEIDVEDVAINDDDNGKKKNEQVLNIVEEIQEPVN